MNPTHYVLIIGGLLALAGAAAMYMPRFTEVAAFLSSSGLGAVGIAVLLDSFSIFSVITAGLCFLLALMVIIREAVRVRS